MGQVSLQRALLPGQSAGLLSNAAPAVPSFLFFSSPFSFPKCHALCSHLCSKQRTALNPLVLAQVQTAVTNHALLRESARTSAATALGLLPWDPERYSLLQSTAFSPAGQLQSAAALTAVGAVLSSADAPAAAGARKQLLGQLLGQLLHQLPELAAEVGPC